MGIPKPLHRYTPTEYYRLEEQAEYRSEYYDGEIFAMAGGTEPHSLICSNINREVGNQLKGKPCAVYDANMRLKIKVTGLVTYPDVSVYCGPRERDPDDPTGQTITNPTVIFEVLSPSTEIYDRRVKASHYRRIESLQALVLVAQDKARVEAYYRQPDGTWALGELEGLDQVLRLEAIDVDLPLVEIYDRIELAKA
jgi:Uma2 family endonuclease